MALESQKRQNGVADGVHHCVKR